MRLAASSLIRSAILRASERPSLLQLVAAFTPFALLLMTALAQPRFGPGLHFSAVRATVWATAILLLPALMLAPYSDWSRTVARLAGLYWTCALLMFLIHLYFGVFTVFDGLADTVDRVGAPAAGFNCFLVGWWCLDVALLWFCGQSRRGISLAHAAAQVFVFLVFAGGLVFHTGPVQQLGLVLVMGVLAATAVRLVLPDRAIERCAAGFASARYSERSIQSIRRGTQDMAYAGQRFGNECSAFGPVSARRPRDPITRPPSPSPGG